MINFEALYKISYGLYLVCSGDKNHGNGYVSNTVFQVTSEPAQFATSCNKDNFTCELIKKYGTFSVSVLHQKTDSNIYKNFGYKTKKDIDKFAGMNIKYGKTDTPIILNDSVAYLECKVVQQIDLGTHWLFIGALVDAQILDKINEPITYSYYRKIIKGVAPKNAPTYINKTKLEPMTENTESKQYRCTVCGYIYDEHDESVKFSDLPDDWECPVCGVEKEEFMEV